MKLIGWNCNGAFRKKNEKILSLKPDILIVSECENIERLKLGKLTPEPNDIHWFGDNVNKGIGVFSYGDYSFELMEEYNPNFKFVIPLKVNYQNESFLLFAVWTKENKFDKNAGYIGQVWFAINYYKNLITNYETIIIGDFNSNKKWDDKRPNSNHSQVVNFLKNNGIESLYHLKYNEAQGEETSPTFLLQKNLNKTYHIDYCFASKEIHQEYFEIRIEEFKDWIEISDHVPIITEFKWRPNKVTIVNSLYESIKSKLELVQDESIIKLNEIKDKILNDAIEFNQDTSEDKESNRIKIVENIEDYLKIIKLLDKIDKRKNV